MKYFLAVVAVTSISLPALVLSEVVDSSSTHFILRHEATSTLPVDELWQRLIRPETWWHPDHTYSGNSGNLSLKPEAGGLWMESWEGGSVTHGTILYVQEGEVLRLNAPFGPLQGLGAYTIWTISISPDGTGSRIVFDEVATGPPSARLAELADAVDRVKTEAIERLARLETAR